LSPVQDSADGAILTVHLQPKSSRTEFAGLHGNALRVRVAAPPIEGAANEALRAFLASSFGLPKRSVTIRSGSVSRHKRILLQGVSAQTVRRVLGLEQA
jgi:uncharacterized protein